MRRSVRVLLVFLAAATILLAVPFAAGAAPQFTGVFNFLENRGPNTQGFSVGLKFQIGAYVNPDPGDPVASVEAIPSVVGAGNPSYTLQPYPYPVRPGLWTNSPPPDFNTQFGNWVFTATSSNNQVSSMTSYFLDNGIKLTHLLPLAQNIVVTPNGTTPTISWDAVPGTITNYQVTLMTAPTNMFYSDNISLSATPQWTVPAGVLSPGQMYTARIRAVYSGPLSAGAWKSVSSAFVNFTTSSPVFNADFNSDPLGTTPVLSPPGLPYGDAITSTCAPTGNPTTIPCDATNSVFQIEDGVVGAAGFPTRHLKVGNTTAGNDPRIRFHPDPAEATGTVFTISWRSASMQPSNDIVFDLYTSGGGGPAARVSYGTLGYIYFSDDGAGQMVLPNPPVVYVGNIPQHFSMVVDFSAGTYDLFIDRAKVVTSAALYSSNNTKNFETGFLVLWENALNNTVLVDDVRMFRGADLDGDGIPDDAVVDTDGDGIADGDDNCLTEFNPDQADADGDGIGDACDACPLAAVPAGAACPSADTGTVTPPDPNTVQTVGNVLVETCFTLNDVPVGVEQFFPPDCYNVQFEVKDSAGNLLDQSCTLPQAYVFSDDPDFAEKPFGLYPLVPGSRHCVTCNIAKIFPPVTLTSYSPGNPTINGLSAPPGEHEIYSVQATFANLLTAPEYPSVWIGSVEAESIQVSVLNGISIRIKAGDANSVVNAGSNGKIPVAILSRKDGNGNVVFDPSMVNIGSVTLNDAHVTQKVKGKSDRYMYSLDQDLNGDGVKDLVVHIDTASLHLPTENTTATVVLKGWLGGCGAATPPDCPAFEGVGTIRIVPGN